MHFSIKITRIFKEFETTHFKNETFKLEQNTCAEIARNNLVFQFFEIYIFRYHITGPPRI